MSETVLKIENLSKQYRLGLIGTGTLSHDFNRWWHKVRRKDDPYLKVGDANDRTIKAESDYVWALRDINFEVKKGEVLGIIGKNGAGKSTLLKILSKVTGPTSGRILAKGRIASLLEVGTGFHPELTGKENIYLNGAILGMSRQEIKNKFDEIVAFSGVERYINTPVKRYSSGMYVRLAFAVAAHLDSEILIVDEVLAVGDIEFQKKCLGKMEEIGNAGSTVLFVSHNMSSIRAMCTSAIYMENGEIVAHGNTSEMINLYNHSFDKKNFNAETELKNSASRRGNGDARFSSIKLLNTKGNATDVFRDEDTEAILRFSIVANKDLKHLNLSILIKSSLNNDTITCTDLIPLIDTKITKGEVLTADLKINLENFRTGSYPLYIWLGDNSNLFYDLVDSVFEINIASDKTNVELGYQQDQAHGYFNFNFNIEKK